MSATKKRLKILRVLNALLGMAWGLLIVELFLHFILKPSESSYGRLLGIDLPPHRVIQEPSKQAFTLDFNDRIWPEPNPLKLTVGDLYGVHREDATLGYTYQENAKSQHGWYFSNNIGANSPSYTNKKPPNGKRRFFIFGESYARGGHIPPDCSWWQVFARNRDDLEVVNLAVDGYSMTQAYLRFVDITKHYDFDYVTFVISPEDDIWREINTIRALVGWPGFTIMPRFIKVDHQLILRQGPYSTGSETFTHDLQELSPAVRDHLRNYDRFYFPLLHENPTLFANLLTYKIFAQLVGSWEKNRMLTDTYTNLKSEGMEIDREIFHQINDFVKLNGKKFALIVLPNSQMVKLFQENPINPKIKIWKERVQIFSEDGIRTLDLLPELGKLGKDQIDHGYPNDFHYGERSNLAIAKIFSSHFSELFIN